jgi:hypothetical protein
MIKAAQLRLHKEKVLAIEGDDESEATGQGQAETGFGDTFEEPEPAQTWVDIATDQSFFHQALPQRKHLIPRIFFF